MTERQSVDRLQGQIFDLHRGSEGVLNLCQEPLSFGRVLHGSDSSPIWRKAIQRVPTSNQKPRCITRTKRLVVLFPIEGNGEQTIWRKVSQLTGDGNLESSESQLCITDLDILTQDLDLFRRKRG